MARIGDSERQTQNRVIRFFRETLHYGYLGDLHEGEHGAIMPERLRANLLQRGYSKTLADGAVAALAGFALPGSRGRRVEKWGATFIDDTYNANPDAMIAALDAFAATPCSGRRIAVLGDMFELGASAAEQHRRVFAHAMALGIPLVIGVGEESSKCLCHLVYKNVAALRKRFRADVSAGDLVLLKASHAMKLGELLD